MSQPSESEEDEISPLEYARQNGLSQNYHAGNLGFPDLKDLQLGLTDDANLNTNLLSFDFGTELKVEDRLPVSKEAASLLSWVSQEQTLDELNALTAHYFQGISNRKRRLELPLLKSDVDADCRRFASRKGFEIKLQDVKLPLEEVRKGEGFDWTKQYENLGTEICNGLKAEKLGVTREAMTFLQNCVNVEWTEEDEKKAWEGEDKYKRVSDSSNAMKLLILLRRTPLEPITPPLSPLPEPFKPFEPSSSDSALNVPVFSDPPSPTAQDFKALEEDIFRQDIPTPVRALPPSDFTLEAIAQESPAAFEQFPSSEPRRAKWDDFKVEVPLMQDQPPTLPRTVRFDDNIDRQFYERFSNSPMAAENQSEFFQESFAEAYKSANLEAEQEKLSREDTTARVDVPDLKFEKPDAPWKPFEEVQNQAALADLQKSFVLETIASSIPKWPQSRAQESKLPWAPFTSNFITLALEDDVPVNDTIWKPFVEDDGDVIDSSSLTWNRDRLKILIDEEDEEEIDFGLFQKDTPPDLSGMVKKRKKEYQDRENVGDNTAAATSKSAKPAAAETGGPFGLLGGEFSVQGSLNNYLELQGLKKPKLTDSSYFTQPAKAPTRENPREITPQQPALPIRKSPAHKESLPVPGIQPLVADTWIVASTTHFKDKRLIKRLESQLPSVKLIERDFKVHNTSAWMPGSVARSPVKSLLDTEADIIISPTVGIVLTTLQKIRQKSPPGQEKIRPEIQQRLGKISARYEKLVVLVSEGMDNDTATGLTESDCLAFADFTGYLSGFETSITIQYVAGGEETLSMWITSSIIQHHVGIELIAEETYWELFLRRAGLNAFAAQAIIGELKAPDGVDPGSPSKAGFFGLTSFVEMGTQDRIARCGDICGRRVLARVSNVVDAKWE